MTHNISGTAKAGVQTVLALLYYRNPFTIQSALGNAMVLGGSAAYAAVKTNANNQPPAPAAAAPAKRPPGTPVK